MGWSPTPFREPQLLGMRQGARKAYHRGVRGRTPAVMPRQSVERLHLCSNSGGTVELLLHPVVGMKLFCMQNQLTYNTNSLV